MKVDQMREKLSRYAIAELSKEHEFTQRGNAKIRMLNFIGGFFLSLSIGHSLKEWSSRICDFLSDGLTVSKAGLQKRLGSRQLSAIKGFLKEVMSKRIEKLHHQSLSEGWFSSFGSVFLEDSVCVSLNSQLFNLFKGSHSKKGKASTARIQLCMNLKTLNYERFDLMGYRDNDQKFSKEILKLLKPGDLIIRDLGYSVLSVFKAIIKMGGFLLSRYKPGMNFYDQLTGKKLDLLDQLEKIHRRGGNFLDIEVFAGTQELVPLRLVALRCPDEIAQERIRKAKKDRHANANHSSAYYELLKWSIFLTNVDAQTWTPADMLLIYGFRWHIEMIFKVWKSKFGLQKLMTKSQIKKPLHAQIFFYLFLSYLVVFYVGYFNYFFERVYKAHQKILSLFGFADFLKKNLLDLIEAQLLGQLDQFIDQLAREACHEKRKNRPSQFELIFQLRTAKKIILLTPIK